MNPENTPATLPDAAPNPPYAIIYADPPWRYSSGPMDSGSCPDNFYATMTAAELQAQRGFSESQLGASAA